METLSSFHSENLAGLQIKVLQDLFEIGVVSFDEIMLKHHQYKPEAPLSPVYFNLRLLRSYPRILRSAAFLYEDLIRPLKFDFLAEVPDAATPIVTAISLDLDVGFRTPRKEVKAYGLKEEIYGLLPDDKGKTALLIDDLTTKATSKFEAIYKLNEHGIDVRDVVVLIDREEGGRVELAKRGIRLHSAFTMTQMMDYYARIGKITPETRKKVQEMIQSPTN